MTPRPLRTPNLLKILAPVGLTFATAFLAAPGAYAQEPVRNEIQAQAGPVSTTAQAASPPTPAALPAPGPRPAVPPAAAPQATTRQAKTDVAPPDDPVADLVQLHELYQTTCAARAYGAYDDICGDLAQQVREAERAARRAHH